MMKAELMVYDSLPCHGRLTINGMETDTYDFGSGHDADESMAEEWGCGKWVWERNEAKKEKAMEKYNLTEDEYDEVCNGLEKGLSAGQCGWCV